MARPFIRAKAKSGAKTAAKIRVVPSLEIENGIRLVTGMPLHGTQRTHVAAFLRG